MNESPRCPKCGLSLPADAPAGLCPKCLVQAGFESQPGSSDPGPTKLTPPASGFEPPTVEELAPLFPQLEILELLGKGGMGAVYKARQPGLDRLVAVKILPPEISRDPAFAERFQREARALARLSHPHIVAVYDFGVVGQAFQPDPLVAQGQAGKPDLRDGLCYIVMEFVDGANLRQAMRTGKLTSAEALAIVPQICEALQFAHDEGIVHRDIKPENILIDKRGRVKIADFGLAKLLGQDASDHSLTATHQVMGTLRYMAPEQMQGSREVDHRADIYSLGVVFYELLTGELPMGKFAPPSKRVQVDVRLDEVVLRALEQDPEQRYQHASDVKSDVDTINRTPSFGREVPPSAGSESTSKEELKPITLLDETMSVWKRWFPVLPSLAGLMSFFIAISLALTDQNPMPWMWTGLGLALFGATLGLTVKVEWDVEYRGHRIRFEYIVLRYKRLMIDGWTAASGGIGWFYELRTTIKDGQGVGDEILCTVEADVTFRCRIIALPKAPISALEQDPEQRYQHAGDVKVELDSIRTTPAPVPQPSELTDPLDGFRDLLRPPRPGYGKQVALPMLLLLMLYVAATITAHIVYGQENYREGMILLVQGGGMVLCITVIVVLNQRFDARKRTAQPPSPAALVVSEPRLSRCAIIGAVWAIFGLLAVIPVLYFIGLNRVRNGTALPTDVIHSEPPLVFSIFMGALLAIGSGAPIGTTIYGGIGIGHIKRSGGKIIGLPLAVADVLFFPLLVLSGLIAALVARVGYSMAPHSNAAAVTSAGAIGVLVALVVCFFVARAVWRAISRQEKSTVKRPGPDSSRRVDRAADTKPPEAMVAQESLPYLLGWLVHWLLQERWFVAILQTMTAFLYGACLIAFFSFQSTNTQTPDGSVSKFQVGQPSAWLTLEASNSGQHASFEFITLTHFVALFGLVSLAVYRWLERRSSGKAHSMISHYFVWGMFLAGAVGFGLFTQADLARQRMIRSTAAARSDVPPLGTITSGIGAEFIVPAGQVAVFEVVTRRDNETVPAPPHCGYVMAPEDTPLAGTFRWSRKPQEFFTGGGSRNWRIEIRVGGGGGGGGNSEGTLLPDELNAAVGARTLGFGRLEPNEEVVHWGADANDLPANGLIGLRVTVMAHGMKAGGTGTGHIDWKKAASATSTTRRKLPIDVP